MAQSVRLSDLLVRQAQSVGDVMSRSGSRQIEHWAKIGKIAEENPDLPYEFILDVWAVHIFRKHREFQTSNKLRFFLRKVNLEDPGSLT